MLALTLIGSAIHLSVLLALPVLIAASLAAYRRCLIRNPYATCRPCKGTGYRRSRLFASSTGYCPDCICTGRRPRPGVHLLNVR
ncbi:hypothetical protein Plo01_76200 [Planobispora longispora]|uniref:Uncharacterized protein n=1 Tax=Planobispora longispora TaxID=28887 RepID=A0A8J3RQS8_9ACTN|nr:hypothetical protein GCM10020093_107710 [Planobispora longispora]GIH81191.1 hypothetical protein Plo01_76200 [Planobispora longispora]